jgi:hypothetical protein
MGPTTDPPGTQDIAQWAARHGISHQPRPDQSWFRAWEPYDTLISPSCYLNSCSWPATPGTVVLAEPWPAEDDEEPMQRAVVGFATHPGLRWRAAIRVGEHFITRVMFLENAPPPIVKLGDAAWDEAVVTRAPTPDEAAQAFHPELRALLQRARFRGHLELRPGGVVIHLADRVPSAASYAEMARVVPQIVTTALRYPH